MTLTMSGGAMGGGMAAQTAAQARWMAADLMLKSLTVYLLLPFFVGVERNISVSAFVSKILTGIFSTWSLSNNGTKMCIITDICVTSYSFRLL